MSQNVSWKVATFEIGLNMMIMGMRGMSNISFDSRMKQLLVLITVILCGILFSLSINPANQQKIKTKLHLETDLNSPTPPRK